MKKDWAEYFKNTENDGPHDTLVKAVRLQGTPGKALDLGCGAGRDTKFLLESGYTVTAVDGDKSAERFISKLPNQLHLKFVWSDLGDYKFEHYDLISSMFTLSFLERNDYKNVMKNIIKYLNPGGMFVGNVFGMNDQWNRPGSDVNFYTKDEILNSLGDLKIRFFKEVDEDGKIADGTSKHWHLFVIIAQKA